MKLWNKILTDDSNTDTDHLRNHSLPFAKDMYQFVYVDKLEEADIVCALADLSSTNSSLQQLNPHQILLVMGLFHIDHHIYTPNYIDYYINRLILLIIKMNMTCQLKFGLVFAIKKFIL